MVFGFMVWMWCLVFPGWKEVCRLWICGHGLRAGMGSGFGGVAGFLGRGDFFRGVGRGLLVERPGGHAFHFAHVAGAEFRRFGRAGVEGSVVLDDGEQGAQGLDAVGGFRGIAERFEFGQGLLENVDGLVGVVIVGGLGGFFNGQAGALRGDGGDHILVDPDVGGILRGEDANRLGVRAGGEIGRGDVVPEDFEFEEALAFERGDGFPAGQHRQGQDIELEDDRGGFLAGEVAEGDLDAAVGKGDRVVGGVEDPVLAEVEFAHAHAHILAGGALQAFQLRLENGGKFFRRIRVVEIPAGAGGKTLEEVFVVAVPEAERGGADAGALEAVGDDAGHLVGSGDADIEMAIAQEEGSASGRLGGFAEFVAAEHPAACEVRAATILDAADRLDGGALAGHSSHGQDDLGAVVENDEGELVVRAQVADD